MAARKASTTTAKAVAAPTTQPTNAVAKAQAMALAQIKANGLVWVPGYGVKGLRTAPIKAATGLSAGTLYLAIMAATMPASAKVNVQGLSQTAINSLVQTAVASGQSWGYIMARTGLSQGAVKRAYTNATGLQATGKRNGRGGRMVQGGTGKPLAHLYRSGAGKATGVQAKVGVPLAKAKPVAKANPKVVGVAPAPTSTAKARA